MSHVVVIGLRTAISLQHTLSVLLSYVLYTKTQQIQIEAIVQTFALGFIVCHLAHQHLLRIVSDHLQEALIACTLVSFFCVQVCAWLHYDIILEAVLGVVFASTTGCLHAILTQVGTIVQTNQNTISSVWIEAYVCMTVTAGTALLLISVYASAEGVFPMARNLVLAFYVVQSTLIYFVIAFAKRLSTKSPASTTLPTAISSDTNRSVRLMYMFLFPFIHATMAYFDIVFVFLVLYTNHIELPHEYIPKSALPWFEADSMQSMSMVVGVYILIGTYSRLLVIIIFSKANDKTCRYGAYAGMIVKLICVGLLPIPYISFYVGIAASTVSGCTLLLYKLPGYNRTLEASMNNYVSFVLLILLQFGRHVDDTIVFAFASYLSSMITFFMVVFFMLVLETSFKPDTSFVQHLTDSAGIRYFNTCGSTMSLSLPHDQRKDNADEFIVLGN